MLTETTYWNKNLILGSHNGGGKVNLDYGFNRHKMVLCCETSKNCFSNLGGWKTFGTCRPVPSVCGIQLIDEETW